MRYPVLFLTLLLCLSGLHAQTPQQWRDSLSVLNAAIEKDRRSTDLRLKKAAVNIQLNQWSYAIEEYGNVLRIDPQNLAALYFRAYANMHIREYHLAKNDYETFLKIAPVNFEARLGLAVVNERLGRHTDAFDDYNRLVQMFPDSAQAYAARAAYERERKLYDISLYDWGEAIKRSPLSPDYTVSKVDLLLTLRRVGEARAELEAARKRGVPMSALREWYQRCK